MEEDTPMQDADTPHTTLQLSLRPSPQTPIPLGSLESCTSILPLYSTIPEYLTRGPHNYLKTMRTSKEELGVEHCLFQAAIMHSHKILMIQEPSPINYTFADDKPSGWTLPCFFFIRRGDPYKIPNSTIAEHYHFLLTNMMKPIWFKTTVSGARGSIKNGFLKFMESGHEAKRLEGVVKAENGVEILTLTTPMVPDCTGLAAGEDPVESCDGCQWRWVDLSDLGDGGLRVSHRVDKRRIMHLLDLLK